VRDELLVLVRREGRPHRLDEQRVEVARGEVVVRDGVEVAELRRDELRVPLGLEVVVGEPAVGRELLLVRPPRPRRRTSAGCRGRPAVRVPVAVQNSDHFTSDVIAHGK
jgi:hypothetical protein